MPVGIVDHDNSTLSRQIIRYASASPRLSVQVLSDEQAAQFALWRGQIDAYMIIPDSLKHDVVMRQPASVSIEGNGSYLLLNKEALTGLSEVVGTVSAGIEIRQYMATGMSKNQAKVAQNPVPLLTQALYNPSQGYGSYVVPAVALLILQQTLLMGTALIIGTWVEQHSAYIRTNLGASICAVVFRLAQQPDLFRLDLHGARLRPRRQLVRRIAVSVRFCARHHLDWLRIRYVVQTA